ncbi:MAG: AraC family transcriptional regulator [Ruthenibacterium sp.]
MSTFSSDSTITRFTQAVQYLSQNLYTPFVLEAMAEHLHLSRFYLITWFKRLSGETPHAYFQRLRMEEASCLLCTTESSIREISEHLNFASPYHFSSTFKAYFGICPRAYRGVWQTHPQMNGGKFYEAQIHYPHDHPT